VKHIHTFESFLTESSDYKILEPIRLSYADITGKPKNINIEKAKVIKKDSDTEVWSIPFKGKNILTAKVKNGVLDPVITVSKDEFNINDNPQKWKYWDEAL
jgi:hypothetical protein